MDATEIIKAALEIAEGAAAVQFAPCDKSGQGLHFGLRFLN
jgi:hypothetical protein